jgi:hypothetical protein
MRPLTTRAEEALVDLVGIPVCIIDDADPAVVGRHGIITDVVWDEGCDGPGFLVTCADAFMHQCRGSALRIADDER